MLQAAELARTPLPAVGREHRQQAGRLQQRSLTFSEALANFEPVELKARAARGPSWAGIVQAVFCRAEGDVSAKRHVALRKGRVFPALHPIQACQYGFTGSYRTYGIPSTSSAFLILALP